MTNTRRLLATSLAALVVLLTAGLGVARWRAAHKKPPVEFDTAAVDRGRIVARVTATGTLSALVTVQVGTQVSGTVQKLFVDWNSPVKKGQLIAKIDPQLFEASLEQAQANYAGGRREPGQGRGAGARRRTAVRTVEEPARAEAHRAGRLRHLAGEPGGDEGADGGGAGIAGAGQGGALPGEGQPGHDARSSRPPTGRSSRAASTSGRRWRRRSRRRRCS